MYQDYYGFTADPFRLTSRGDNLYMHDSFKRAMSYLLYAFHRGEGMVMITGSPGSGKTTLVAELVAEGSGTETPICVVDCSNLAGGDLLELYLDSLGIAYNDDTNAARTVRESLILMNDAGQRPILILDDAHLLGEEDFNRVHTLCNMQHGTQPLVQVVLVGQHALREKMLSPGYEQLHQRLIATCDIRALELAETREYIMQKLRSVNWNNNPNIAESVYGAIHRSSLGIPRWTDLICSRMLLNAMASDRKFVSLQDICEVIRDLLDEDLLPRQVRHTTQEQVA